LKLWWIIPRQAGEDSEESLRKHIDWITAWKAAKFSDKPLEVARARTSFMGGYNMREGEKNGQTFCRFKLSQTCATARDSNYVIPPMKE